MSSALTRASVERVTARVARRWTQRDLDAFQAGVRRSYQDARVALRAARGAQDPLRLIDFLVVADGHRHYARRQLVRLRACRAMLRSIDGGPSTDFGVCMRAYVDMMCEIYRTR